VLDDMSKVYVLLSKALHNVPEVFTGKYISEDMNQFKT
jgi:hypothetical protein